jgi:hypothetical protein
MTGDTDHGHGDGDHADAGCHAAGDDAPAGGSAER